MRWRFQFLCIAALTAASATAHAQFPRTAVDPALSDRGAKIYASDCAKCHGADTRGVNTDTRGNDAGPDLIRSTVVLHDRRENLHGKELAPYLKSTPPHHFDYNTQQAEDLSQFLTASVNRILRSGYDDKPTHLLDGDAKAGEVYFAANCAKCHSATGDLKGVGTRYTAAALQQKFLFPNTGIGKKQPVEVTVRLANGRTLSGDLLRMDDFTVTFTDKSGVKQSINRTAGVKVTTVDPYAGHYELLDKYTDADIHNLTAYLDTLK